MVPGSPMYAYANCNTGSWRVLKWLEPATLPFVRSAAVVTTRHNPKESSLV